ncbi:hypothetical protein SDC9_85843 [bioreactor metagenome]|uniref:Uncharacterized protein n=1 Tax=bioreactor metagenome TaxID=1076179 RepID=A0A644ZEB0_9ZZZZ|nr:hypothetical protein [Oscillospiraceae bacterium]
MDNRDKIRDDIDFIGSVMRTSKVSPDRLSGFINKIGIIMTAYAVSRIISEILYSLLKFLLLDGYFEKFTHLSTISNYVFFGINILLFGIAFFLSFKYSATIRYGGDDYEKLAVKTFLFITVTATAIILPRYILFMNINSLDIVFPTASVTLVLMTGELLHLKMLKTHSIVILGTAFTLYMIIGAFYKVNITNNGTMRWIDSDAMLKYDLLISVINTAVSSSIPAVVCLSAASVLKKEIKKECKIES